MDLQLTNKDGPGHRFDERDRPRDRPRSGARGSKVTINGRTEASVQAALKEIGSGLLGAAADVLDRRGCDTLIAAMAGSVDILINNAGIFEPNPFTEIPDADWERFYQVNVLSGVRLTRAFLPGMLLRNWGRVIFISSESGSQIPEEMIHYGMTKAAELALVNGIAQLTKGTAVTVNAVLPGPTASDGVADFVGKLASKAQQTPRNSSASSSAACVPPRCSSVSPAWRKWRIR